jgi:SAM-dependent methyltransferase
LKWRKVSGVLQVARARILQLTRRLGPSPFGDLRRVEPVSRVFGLDRGLPIDRWYIETFLQRYAEDLRGVVLEVGDDRYTRRFGRPTRSDVLNVYSDMPGTTLVGDLSKPDSLPEAAYDCIICIQTLQFIYDLRTAVASMRRALRPGGVALCSLSGISQISRYDMDRWGDYWRFTSLSAQMLFDREFGRAKVEVETFGNVLAAVAFLEGISAQELTPRELSVADADYELVITVRALAGPS